MNKVALFVVNAENLKTLKYHTFLEKTLVLSTIMEKIYETNSSFQVK